MLIALVRQDILERPAKLFSTAIRWRSSKWRPRLVLKLKVSNLRVNDLADALTKATTSRYVSFSRAHGVPSQLDVSES